VQLLFLDGASTSPYREEFFVSVALDTCRVFADQLVGGGEVYLAALDVDDYPVVPADIDGALRLLDEPENCLGRDAVPLH